MRERKFKAWLKNEKKMVEVEEINFIYEEVMFKDYKTSFMKPIERNISFEDIELIEYTGRIDKNGKKIFDKDIVKLNGYLWVVYWSDEESCFKMKNKFDDLFLTKYKEKALEVVGNIYENKELLEGEK